MVKFVDIDPKDIDTDRYSRRGRVSYPILKAFMERQTKLSILDVSDLDKDPNYLRSVLGAYIKSHRMPIQIFSAGGKIHLMRLDLDNDHKQIPWVWGGDDKASEASEGAKGADRDVAAAPINAKEVSKRAKAAADTTK